VYARGYSVNVSAGFGVMVMGIGVRKVVGNLNKHFRKLGRRNIGRRADLFFILLPPGGILRRKDEKNFEKRVKRFEIVEKEAVEENYLNKIVTVKV